MTSNVIIAASFPMYNKFYKTPIGVSQYLFIHFSSIFPVHIQHTVT